MLFRSDHHPWAGDQDSLLGPIASFLEQLSPPAVPRRRSSGSRPRAGWTALTAAEQQVAERAAHGLSNPEIARELSVARSTVETHLKRVYSKLGIDGRHQLPRSLGSDQPGATPLRS